MKMNEPQEQKIATTKNQTSEQTINNSNRNKGKQSPANQKAVFRAQSETERDAERMCSQQTRELIDAGKMSDKHDKDLGRLC